MNKKIFVISLLLFTISLFTLQIIVNAKNLNNTVLESVDQTYTISPESNFFGQPEDKTLVALPEDYEQELAVKGYDFVASTEKLELYVKERNFNIAIYDKVSKYLWYSVKSDYLQYMLSGTSRFFVESGVIIEYYNLDNIAIEDNRSYLSGPKYNVDITYEYLDNGVIGNLVFEDLGISFSVVVSISEDKLNVNLPTSTIKEEDVVSKVLNLDGTTSEKITKYRLRAVYLFPYFGSENYEINGYSMIPDGSGALIRYNDTPSSTAYIKRIYGEDEGVLRYREETTTSYIRDELTATLPVFGVNHGYKQAAFLSVVSEGDGYSEIHSYPYGYNAYPFNTTFAKFILRERYTIQTSANQSDSFQMVTENVYPTDYSVDYYFLANEEASYSGMAKKYREILEINRESKAAKAQLTLIGLDFKNGLFGKDFVKMTDYEDVLEITNDLNESGLANLDLIYQAWNQGGYYDNNFSKPKAARILGGTKDFLDMNQELKNLGVDVFYLNNPMLSYSQALGRNIIRKPTLSLFQTNEGRTSLFLNAYYTNPDNVANSILKYKDNYASLNIDNLALATVGDTLFTYRSNSLNISRDQMADILTAELAELTAYNLAAYQPNSYLWKSLDSYLFTPIESNKYAYVTDSIPFIQLVLVGSVNMYSNYINYVSDYDLFALRLIEYGVSPAFLITKEPTFKLRYTNSEFIYTSQYDLWKSTILSISDKIIDPLLNVTGEKIISHRYIQSGVAEVMYENNVTIYVNYNQETISLTGGITLEPYNFKVVIP